MVLDGAAAFARRHRVSNTPLSGWRVQKAFDSAKECEDYSTLYWGLLKGEPQKQETFMRVAQCISSDDPRLKPN